MKKKSVCLVAAMSMMLASFAGCGKKENSSLVDSYVAATEGTFEDTTENPFAGVADTEDITTEDITTEDDVTSAGIADNTTAPSLDNHTVTVGYFVGSDTYVDDDFDLMLVLPSGWIFQTVEETANSAKVDVEQLKQIWNGEKSVYDEAISYLCIAYKMNGSNIIYNYFSPKAYGMPENLSSEDYLASALSGYDGATLTKETLAGQTFDCLTIPAGDRYQQKIYCKDKNGIILMITFTIVLDETDDCVGFFQ